MICIFCKKDSSSSISVEHIVPESLGNKSHILEKGIVCDTCNNYFSLKIEKPVLELAFFNDLRFRNKIESKKGKIPKGTFLIPNNNYKAEVTHVKGETHVKLDSEIYKLFENGTFSQFIVPRNTDFPKNNKWVSRFIAKIAFEMFASKLMNNKEYLFQFVNDDQFDTIRNYIRYNKTKCPWLYYSRKIYDQDEKFYLESGETADIIFESDFLFTSKRELYFIIAIKGIEFTINLVGPSIDGYEEWLIENGNISPLYREGTSFGINLTPNFLRKK